MDGLRIRHGQKLLFVGDSNTDCEYRTRAQPLGYGFVMMVHAMLRASRPELAFEVVNRGNDGDTVVDLAGRWEEDVLRLDPDWLLVMIGTNDVGYRFLPDYRSRAVEDEAFEQTLAELVGRRRPSRASVALIEPPLFELPVDSEPNRQLRHLSGLLARTAERFACEVVPVQDGMAAAQAGGLAGGWFQNINHPAFPGHAFLAQQVLRRLGWKFG